MRKMGGIVTLLLAALVAVSLFSIVGSAVALSNSGGGSWQYYKEITVSENSGSTLAAYQVFVQLSSSNFPTNARSDGADVRFTDASGNELSYWIESWDYAGRNAKVWVKVPSIPASAATTIRMYYGNPSAGSSGNGITTFDFFEDFSGDLSKWTASNVEISGGVANAIANGGSITTVSNIVPRNAIVRADVKLAGDYDVDVQYVYVDANNYIIARVSTYSGAAGCVGGGSYGSKTQWDKVLSGTYYCLNTQLGPTIALNSWYRLNAMRVGTSYELTVTKLSDSSTESTSAIVSDSVFDTSAKIKIYFQAAGGKADNIFVRKYASSEPTLTLGAEQTTSTPTPTTPASTTPAPTTPTPTATTPAPTTAAPTTPAPTTPAPTVTTPAPTTPIPTTPTPTLTPTTPAKTTLPATRTPTPTATSLPAVVSVNGKVATIKISSVAAEQYTTVEIPSKKEQAVSKIALSVKNSVSDASLNIETMQSKPVEVKIDVPGEVYRYISINPQGIQSSDLYSAEIGFKIEKSWITSNNIDQDTVALYKYNDGQWYVLSTNKLNEDSDYIYYSATTSGFSIFAISGQSGKSETNWVIVGGIGALILLGIIAITKLRPKKEKHAAQQESIVPISPSTFPLELKPNYTDIEIIGEGGFARVFKANRKKDNKTVAVKIPRLDEKTGKAFLNEIMAWHNLNHENIVKLFDANVHPVPYLEMEYIDGVEISGNRIRDLEHYPKPLKEERAVEIIKGIAEGLRHAHSKGVVHRDLKPLNVLITSSSKPKITDFGLAKLSAESKLSTLKGYSPLYAAPEQLDSAEYGKPDERTDIYQLGVIFYELLTGKLPYEGYTQSEVSTKIITPAILPTKPSAHNPELEKFDDVVMRCLAKRKENRFRDVHEFLEQLEKASEKESLVEQLKKTLNEQKETLKKSRSSEEIVKSKRMVVETLGRLAVIHAESKNKTELLNALEDLKFYTVKNIGELSKAIEQLEFMMKNESGVSEQFVSGIKNLVHKIRREYEL